MSVRILTLFDLEPIEPKAASAVKQKRAPKAIEAPAENSDVAIKKPKASFPSKSIANTSTAEKNYYSIGETAAMFKVRTSHIRFWTVQFGLKMRTTRKGDRLYTPENIEQLKVIHHLVKEQGFTIAGAKIKLKEVKNVPVGDLQKNNIVASLLALRNSLISLRNQI